ncbi:MAG: type II toxin-antitoxin system RelE/ParE family toxin [Methylococcales bacterium]
MIWTPSARADLKAIHEYITKDAPLNAKAVVREIVRKTESLAEFPYLGKTIPEVNDDSLREISAYAWRILYHLHQNQIFILAVVHKRRQLSADEVSQRIPGG